MHIHAHTHACTHTHTHSCIHTRTRTHARTHARTHTHTHRHTRTHTHTHNPTNIPHCLGTFCGCADRSPVPYGSSHCACSSWQSSGATSPGWVCTHNTQHLNKESGTHKYEPRRKQKGPRYNQSEVCLLVLVYVVWSLSLNWYMLSEVYLWTGICCLKSIFELAHVVWNLSSWTGTCCNGIWIISTLDMK